MKKIVGRMKKGAVVLSGVLAMAVGSGVAHADNANVYYEYTDGTYVTIGNQERFRGYTEWTSDSISSFGSIMVASESVPGSNYASAAVLDAGIDYAKGAKVEAATDLSKVSDMWPGGVRATSADASASISIVKEFSVTQSGDASITLSLTGLIKASGAGTAGYSLQLGDSSPFLSGKADAGERYDVAESFTIPYSFDTEDIGTTFALQMYLNIYADNEGEGYALADFSEGLKINSISGGVEAIGDPISTVPVPGAVWLLGSGLIGLAGAARRKMRK